MKKIFALILVLCLVMTVGCGAKTSSESSKTSSSKNFSMPSGVPESFILKGGNGLWNTTLNIKKDGSYSGEYLEQTGDEFYEDVTYYNFNTSEYYGNFKSIEKIDEYTYCLTLGEYGRKYETGDSWMDGNKVYTATEGEGFFGCEKFMLYLPGRSTSDLPQNFLIWVPDKISGGKLTTFVIHNTVSGYGFVSVN